MTLGEYIEKLKTLDPEKKVPIGLGGPHSWRGRYDELAFEPVKDTTVKEMLEAAESALNSYQHGWKGGDYFMTEETPIHVEYEGAWSDDKTLFNLLLDLMTMVKQKENPND